RGRGNVGRNSPMHGELRAVDRRLIPPISGRRTKNSFVALAVAVEIAGHRFVAGQAESGVRSRAVRARDSIPETIRRPEYDIIGAAVAVKIARTRNVAARAPMGVNLRAVDRAERPPIAA